MVLIINKNKNFIIKYNGVLKKNDEGKNLINVNI